LAFGQSGQNIVVADGSYIVDPCSVPRSKISMSSNYRCGAIDIYGDSLTIKSKFRYVNSPPVNGYVMSTDNNGFASWVNPTSIFSLTGGYGINYSAPNISVDTTVITSQTRLNKTVALYQPLKTNLTSIGNLSNATGYLYNNGSGTFSYANISGWGLTGNSGTTAGTNFIGTTDATDLVLKANSVEHGRFVSGGGFKITGAGSSSSTNTLQVLNSSSTSLMTITDDGHIGMNSGSLSSSELTIKMFSSNLGNYGLRILNTSGTSVFDFGDDNNLYVKSGGLILGGYNSSVGTDCSINGGNNSLTRLLLSTNSGGNIGELTLVGGAFGSYGVASAGTLFLDNVYGNTFISSRTGSIYLGGILTGAIMTVNNNINVGIGTTSPNTSSVLDLESTTQGFLPPQMTTTQKTAISSPKAGLVVYDTTLNKLSYYNGSTWINL